MNSPSAQAPTMRARSPIEPAAPVTTVAGWEVSARRSDAELTIVDATPLAKVQVKAPPDGEMAGIVGVPFGRAARDEQQNLVTGAGPGEWVLFAAPGTSAQVVQRLQQAASGVRELVTVIDLTHGRAVMRISGDRTADLLAKVCPTDFTDALVPDGAAFRSAVARVVTDVVRDDRGSANRSRLSYLLHCERSSGQYLFEALVDAGAEFGVGIDGFPALGDAAGPERHDFPK